MAFNECQGRRHERIARFDFVWDGRRDDFRGEARIWIRIRDLDKAGIGDQLNAEPAVKAAEKQRGVFGIKLEAAIFRQIPGAMARRTGEFWIFIQTHYLDHLHSQRVTAENGGLRLQRYVVLIVGRVLVEILEPENIGSLGENGNLGRSLVKRDRLKRGNDGEAEDDRGGGQHRPAPFFQDTQIVEKGAVFRGKIGLRQLTARLEDGCFGRL